MMQDFKTAHLLGVSPRAQFFAMLLGSAASVFVSVAAYALYTAAWAVPSPELPAPTAMIWLDMASLVRAPCSTSRVFHSLHRLFCRSGLGCCLGACLLCRADPIAIERLPYVLASSPSAQSLCQAAGNL